MVMVNSELSGRRLLIVENDPHDATKLLRACQTIGVEAEVSNDPAKALGRAARGRWDGAILSLTFQNESMLCVADKLSQRSLPFIFTVNDHGEGVPLRYARVPQLVKPLQRERIVHLITTCADAPQSENKENPVLAELLAECEPLRDLLAPYALQVRRTLSRPGCAVRDVIFIESGMCAVIGKLGANETEIGLIGNEGVVGAWIGADVETTPFRITVQIEGMAAALPAQALQRAMEKTPKIGAILMRYQHDLDMQFAAAATANATLCIESRLARWLVMCSDRIGAEIPVVHEDLSAILSVRRSGVTEAVHQLERAGLIAPRRGFVRVVDRERLVRLSMGAHEA
ncbi:helix-turn-helix domain-containing protein [Rhodoblastus sp.]|uniref:helix-turn-helix domain-containing protein n=2 Tax=Rhodoblastus sp. TaxID=1962975 RepID=UPI003F989F2A